MVWGVIKVTLFELHWVGLGLAIVVVMVYKLAYLIPHILTSLHLPQTLLHLDPSSPPPPTLPLFLAALLSTPFISSL